MYAFQIPFQKLAGQLEKVMLPPLVRLSMKSGMFNCRRGIIKGICMHVMLSPKDMALIQVTEVLPWVIQVSMYIGIPYQMLTCKIGMIPACLRCNSGRPKYISRPCLTKNPGTRWKQNRVNWHIYLAKIYGRKYTGDRESNLYGAQTDKESRFDLPPWNDKESSSSEWSSKLYKEVLTDKNLVDKVRELNKQAERWVTRVLKWLRIRRWSYQTLIWCYHTKSALTPSWFKFLPPLAIHTPLVLLHCFTNSTQCECPSSSKVSGAARIWLLIVLVVKALTPLLAFHQSSLTPCHCFFVFALCLNNTQANCIKQILFLWLSNRFHWWSAVLFELAPILVAWSISCQFYLSDVTSLHMFLPLKAFWTHLHWAQIKPVIWAQYLSAALFRVLPMLFTCTHSLKLVLLVSWPFSLRALAYLFSE